MNQKILVLILTVIFSFTAVSPNAQAVDSCAEAMNTLTWGQKFKGWYRGKLVRFGSNASYYTTRRALNELYPASGPSALDARIIDYFPVLLDEMDARAQAEKAAAKERAQKTRETTDDVIEIYNSGTKADYLSEQEFKPFRTEFLRLLTLRRNKAADGMTGTAEFKEFATKTIEFYKKKTEMQRLIAKHHTFKTLFEVELKERFISSGYTTLSPFEKKLYKYFESPFIIYPMLSAKWGLGIVGVVIAGATISNFIPNYINRYTASPQNVVLQKVEQIGIRHFTPATNWIQYKMVDMSTITTQQNQVRQFAAEIKKVNLATVNTQSPQQAENEINFKLAPVKEFARPVESIINQEQSDYENLLKLSVNLNTQEAGILPANQAGGRSLYWNSQVFFPGDMAFRIAGFQSFAASHETVVLLLKDKLARMKTDPQTTQTEVDQIQNEISRHEKDLQINLESAAQTVAIWKVNEFLFPELTKKWLNGKDIEGLTSTYNYMKSSYHYDYYVAAYDKQINFTVAKINELLRLRLIAVKAADTVDAKVVTTAK